MTLRDKFKRLKISQKNTTATLNIDTAIECEQIADDFAIEFAEWLEDSIYKENNFIKMDVVKRIKYTTNELLEIFKIEKGL